MKKLTIPFFLLLFCLILNTILYADDKVSVVFINSDPFLTKLGLAKFILGENGDPVDYTILHEGWRDEKKVIMLESGFYGVTKYEPYRGIIRDFKMFSVEDKPLIINM